MREIALRRFVLALGAGLCLAACHGSRAPESPLKATLAPRAPLRPFARETITIRLENKGERPLALVGTPPAFDVPAAIPATVQGDTVRLVGTVLVDDVGAEARAPLPPRTTWDGAGKLVTFPLLAPGQATERVLSVVVKPEKPSLRLEAVPLTKEFLVYALSSRESLPMAAPETRGGFRPALQDRLVFQAGAALVAHPMMPLPGPEGTAPLAQKLYPQGVAQDLPAPTIVLDLALPLLPPAIALEHARQQAGIAAGPAVWVDQSATWVLDGDDGATLVDAAGVHPAPGRWTALAEAIAADGRSCVTLFDAAPEATATALVSGLRGAGLDASSSPAKGGGLRGTVCLEASDLIAASRAFSERGLRLEGLLAQ